MRAEEAKWIGEHLAAQPDEMLSPVLELGASTRNFRTIVKPHIDNLIHRPLRERGIKVVHTDLKADDGVDISGNFYDPQIRAQIAAFGAHCVLCCNIFEHVTDRAGFAAICDELLAPGGLMVVTVPYSYPHHMDPIDTGYRPRPEEIVALFPGYRTVASAVVSSASYFDDLKAESGSPVVAVIKSVAKSVLLRGGLEQSFARLHRLLWLFRPYRVSAAVLQKA